MTDSGWAEARRRLVRRLELRGIGDPRVLRSIASVPRHLFVPSAVAARAYEDEALPIEEGQTISQPYVVALMTDLLRLKPGSKVLEIGTGSGYQAAVLAALGASVYSVEISEELAKTARLRLARLGYHGIHVKVGDGFHGWKEYSPFDAIVVTAATPEIPDPLVRQLAEGGVIVAPIVSSDGQQWLVQGLKRQGNLRTRRVTGVIFVPMLGEVRRRGFPGAGPSTPVPPPTRERYRPGPPPLSSRAPLERVAPISGHRGEAARHIRRVLCFAGPAERPAL